MRAGEGDPPRKWFKIDFRRAIANAIGLGGALAPIVGTVAALTTPAPAVAGILYPYKRRTAIDRLAGVPCFLITSARGRPFTIRVNNQKHVLMFLDHQDAEEYAQHLAVAAGMNKMHISAISMPKGFKKHFASRMMIKPPAVVVGATPHKLRRRVGYRKIVWSKFVVSTEMSKIAANLPGVCDSAWDTVPLFFIKGLEIKKNGKRMMPYFFSYYDCVARYDEARAAWLKAQPADAVEKQTKDVEWPESPKVMVDSLMNVMAAISDMNDDNCHMGFVPDSRQIEWVRKSVREGPKQARIMEE